MLLPVSALQNTMEQIFHFIHSQQQTIFYLYYALIPFPFNSRFPPYLENCTHQKPVAWTQIWPTLCYRQLLVFGYQCLHYCVLHPKVLLTMLIYQQAWQTDKNRVVRHCGKSISKLDCIKRVVETGNFSSTL